VGSLKSRLDRLEARSNPPPAGRLSPRAWERYLHVHENARRVNIGLEPLPDLPYTKEDHEEDLDTLQTTIAAYRNSAGWKTEESRAFLDEWERETRERLYGKRRERSPNYGPENYVRGTRRIQSPS
jgi:hypothetical protein